jgi:hypothetical protein
VYYLIGTTAAASISPAAAAPVEGTVMVVATMIARVGMAARSIVVVKMQRFTRLSNLALAGGAAAVADHDHERHEANRD